GTGEVKGRVSALAQQKAVSYPGGIGVASDDIAAGVNARGAGSGSSGPLGGSARWTEINPSGAGRVNRAEAALAEQKAMAFAGGIVIPSNNIAASIDVEGLSQDSAREVNRREGWLLRGGRAKTQHRAKRDYRKDCESPHLSYGCVHFFLLFG